MISFILLMIFPQHFPDVWTPLQSSLLIFSFHSADNTVAFPWVSESFENEYPVASELIIFTFSKKCICNKLIILFLNRNHKNVLNYWANERLSNLSNSHWIDLTRCSSHLHPQRGVVWQFLSCWNHRYLSGLNHHMKGKYQNKCNLWLMSSWHQ